MTPRPFHRSKSFWLGVLVLVFLGWAWMRSVRHYDTFRIADSTGSSGVILSQRDSKVILTAPGKLPIIPGVGPISIPLPYPRDKPLLPPIFTETHTAPSYHTLALAHWFLILVFLLPWTAFLRWRYRRLKRFAVTAGSTDET